MECEMLNRSEDLLSAISRRVSMISNTSKESADNISKKDPSSTGDYLDLGKCAKYWWSLSRIIQASYDTSYGPKHSQHRPLYRRCLVTDSPLTSVCIFQSKQPIPFKSRG
ncbi:uncharacterized protein SPPG_09370 [Spizellomyces punctatus DAOM BR117]|uniref:Uncharacterized protein n=1 Tax=Spizellomyces punctatus (strain DAOM BR117) TaxID=645134 RepID=A0A0L0HAT2_SPIPD|nr:uncharacterized protein SPPG_09370 [Spizellomyces punctatus DAOM BR117]KNC98004.1 hypothetical protein SPPG_09370 [Spizellomyces punctatus DAOM BR117]|eukprot:XP_016606044.1 hypothetical protein SPPG_09370 [Spizellomyces punctatus DAOM BR117]